MNGGLVLRQVGKTYGGRRALIDVSTTFAPGKISVVLGPNGAGKTTLLGILSTLVPPSTGELLWDAVSLGRTSPARARIGYVGHDPGLYGDLTARENLDLFAALHGVPDGGGRARAMLVRVGLDDVPAEAQARTFSRGMQQRLALVDEPSSALDPAGAAWLQTELAAERDAGRIVVLVTHDLDAAGAIAEHAVVLRRGRVAFDEDRPGGFGAEALRAVYERCTRG
jgi:ABC-type multidrug transport system ATPase subunit